MYWPVPLRKVAVVAALVLATTGVVWAQTWVELILDASGSMYNTLEDGRYRITAAKDALGSFIAGLPADPDLHVGLRIYGSELQALDPESCLDSRLFVPLQGLDRTALLDTVNAVLARGATPLAWSLEQAGRDFTQPGKRMIVLVTDGEESCGGDIRQVMADLAAAGIDIDLRIIGFDLTDEASRSFDGVGTFENARSAEELAAALGRAVSEAIVTPGQATYEVTVNLTRSGLPAEEGTVVEFTHSVDGLLTTAGRSAPGKHLSQLTAGTYSVTVRDAYSESPLSFSGLRVLPEGPNEFTFELAASFEVTVSTDTTSVFIGDQLTVNWSGGPTSGEHWLTLVRTDAADSDSGPGSWVTGESGMAEIVIVGEPTVVEVRYLLQLPDGGSLVAGRSEAITVTVPPVSIEVPAEAAAGSRLTVHWTAAGGPHEYITIVPAGSPAERVTVTGWTEDGNPLQLRAPDEPGDYEVRYLSDSAPGQILAMSALNVTANEFAIVAPAAVEAGAYFSIQWTGPNGPYDYISIAPVEASQYVALQYEYTAAGNPLSLLAPGTAGAYELRYSSDEADHAILFSTPIAVTAAAITLTAPESVAAGSSFTVSWTVASEAEWDYVTIVPVEASDGTYLDYAYTSGGSSAQLTAPDEPGAYEIRYASDSRPGTFARWPIQVR